jgi:flagellar basal body-associated protein FliL
MAKEAPENEEKTEGGEDQNLPMFSKKGKLVFLVVAVVQFAIFGGLFYLVTLPEKKSEVLNEKMAEKSVKDLNGPRININKPIVISIPTNELATEFRHLAIELVIIVGRVKGEEGANFDLIQSLTQEQFLETAEKFEPFVKDQVNKIAMGYTYLQLQQDTTKNDFAKRLRESLNNILEEYGLKPRFTEVLLTSFIFSD